MELESINGFGWATIKYTKEEGKLKPREFEAKLCEFMDKEMPRIRWTNLHTGGPGRTTLELKSYHRSNDV